MQGGETYEPFLRAHALWSPRILGIAFAIFLSLFALDAIEEGQGFQSALLGLSIHLIPSAAIVITLAAAWRREWIGAGLFAMLAVFYGAWALPEHVDWAAIIALPLLLIAALFLANRVERGKVRGTLAR